MTAVQAPTLAPTPAASSAVAGEAASSGRGPAMLPATLMVLGSCSSLQVGAALATHLFPAAGALGATLLRLSLAAVLLLAVSRPRIKTWTRAQWRAVLLFAMTLAGMNGFFYAAIARIPLGIAVTIEFLGPLALSVVLSRRVRELGWVLLALLGVGALGWTGESGSGGSLDPVGIAFVLVAAAFWALYILAGARASAAVPGRGGLAVAMAAAAIVLAPSGIHGAAHALGRPSLILVALGTALMASVVPYSLEFAALRRLPKRTFGILLSLEPAVAALAGWLLLSQSLGPLAVLAILAVVAASIGSTLASAKA